MSDNSIIIYLADCIAATAHDFNKKSVPKNERKRHLELCIKVADIMDGKWFPGGFQKRPEDVIKRLREAVEMLAKYNN